MAQRPLVADCAARRLHHRVPAARMRPWRSDVSTEPATRRSTRSSIRRVCFATGGAIDDRRTSSAKDIAGATNYVRAALDAGLARRSIAVAQTQPYGCEVKY